MVEASEAQAGQCLPMPTTDPGIRPDGDVQVEAGGSLDFLCAQMPLVVGHVYKHRKWEKDARRCGREILTASQNSIQAPKHQQSSSLVGCEGPRPRPELQRIRRITGGLPGATHAPLGQLSLEHLRLWMVRARGPSGPPINLSVPLMWFQLAGPGSLDEK